jgi:hypothetical protein
MKFLPFLTIGAVLLGCATTAGAGLYRWVDENGQVHYSDRVPPEQSKGARIEFSKRGMPIREIDPAKTAEEMAREQELERMRREQQELIAEQRESDRVLLRAFPTEDDVIMARDGKLATVDIAIGVIFNNLKRMKQKLVGMQQEVDAKLSAGEAVSPSYQAQMSTLRQQIQDAYGQIVQEEERKLGIRDEYARYLKRYQELKNLPGQTGPTQVEGDGMALQLETVVACDGEDQCAGYWRKARTYLEDHAQTPVVLSASAIVMTAPPRRSEDMSLTVSLIPREDEAGNWVFLDLQCYSTPIGERLCESEQARAIRRGFRPAITGGALAVSRTPPAETLPTPAPGESAAIR